MNIKSAYIPRSGKAVTVARVLGLRTAEVRGRYLSNVADPTPEQAARLAWILEPERAETAQNDEIAIALAAVDDPRAYGMTQEQADRHYDYIQRGGWALAN